MSTYIFNKIINYLVLLSIASIALITGSFVIETQQSTLQSQTDISNAVTSNKRVTKVLMKDVDTFAETVVNHIDAKDQSSKVIKISNFPVTQGFLSSKFGMRKDPIDGQHRMHQGIDIAARSGTEINPMGSGIVIFAGRKAGYGKTVEIKHGHSVITRYSHLKKIVVKLDQEVTEADVIGFVGNSGRSTGPHLHLEVALGSDKVDPQTFLAGQIASKSKPMIDTFEQASLQRVSYQDYLQNIDGLYGLKAPDH